MFCARRVKEPLALFVFCNLMIMNCFSEASRVSLRQDAKGAWELVRNGETMRVLGVGGTKFLPLAKEMGANSVRVWDTKQLLEKNTDGKTVLAEIEELGLTFCAGIWVEHERHGFSYLDPAKVQKQRERVRAAVRLHKDHPNLLVWGLGTVPARLMASLADQFFRRQRGWVDRLSQGVIVGMGAWFVWRGIAGF